MKILVVVWTAYACAGGSCGALVPAKAQPLICTAQPTLEMYDPARAAEARRRVSALGEPAALFTCQGLGCSKISSWSPVVKFREKP